MLYFNLQSPHNRTVSEWRSAGKSSPWTNAKNHARKHGVAGAWKASDAFVLFYMDQDKLRQKTWEHATPVR